MCLKRERQHGFKGVNMLKPAIRYKDILLKKFSELIYTDEYYFYAGWPYEFQLPEIGAEECRWQWAIIDASKETEEDSVIGYFSYRVDTISDRISQFGLYSFDPGNIIVGQDVFEKMEELVQDHHSIEWRMIAGNPVKRSYDRFCNKHNGNISVLHDVTKDRKGNYIDEYIYEIVKP